MNKESSEQRARDFQALPAPQSCRVIDFEIAQVVSLPTQPPKHVLVVSGEAPYAGMKISLEPLVYIRQPEYWGIEVVGCLTGGGAAVLTPYVVHLNLEGRIGTRGIAVIGANRSENINISGHSAEQE
ncbi:MAG: hypothetical protein ACRDRU_23110 [Pseudonocardiaceae bacterium]